MGLRYEDLDDIFTYHSPTVEQQEKYKKLRAGALEFARIILDNTPISADQTVAIRKVREAIMIANASVALNGRF